MGGMGFGQGYFGQYAAGGSIPILLPPVLASADVNILIRADDVVILARADDVMVHVRSDADFVLPG